MKNQNCGTLERDICVPVDPIGNIEGSVDTKRGQIVRCNCLCLPCPLKHEELRQNSDRFEENRKRPQNLGEGELVVEDEGEYKARADEIFDFEGINGWIICRTFGGRRDQRQLGMGKRERTLTGIDTS